MEEQIGFQASPQAGWICLNALLWVGIELSSAVGTEMSCFRKAARMPGSTQGDGVCFEDYFNLPLPLFWKAAMKKMTAPLLERLPQKQTRVAFSEGRYCGRKITFSKALPWFCNCILWHEVRLWEYCFPYLPWFCFAFQSMETNEGVTIVFHFF